MSEPARLSRLLRVAVFFLLCCLTLAAHATELVLDPVERQSPRTSLTPNFDVLEDVEGKLTWGDLSRPDVAARFKASGSDKSALNFGLTRSVYWLRLVIRNDHDLAQTRLLEIASGRLAKVDLHLTAAAGEQHIETGYARPFAQRPYANRFLIFPLSFAPGSETVIHLRFESPALEIPAVLWIPDAYHTVEMNDHWAQAIYFGLAAAMILYNLLLWILLREKSYGFYLGFVLSIVLAVASASGVGPQFIWGDQPYWTTVSLGVCGTLATMFQAPFMRRLLHTGRHAPRLDRALVVAFWLSLVASVANMIHYNAPLGLVVTDGCVLLFLLVAVYCSFKRMRTAYFFLAAYLSLLLGALATGLRIAGIVPTNLITSNAFQFGTAVEMILLAFALADRFNAIRAEKAQAQAEALVAQQRLVDVLRESERELEGRVAERTAELSETIARLQQTQADLVQADKLASLGALVAGVAHELNTPIGVAVTTSSTLEGAARELRQNMAHGEMRKSTVVHFVETAEPMAELILRSCNRAAALITSFKQIAVDQTSEQRRSFELRSLVEDNIATLRPSFRDDPWVIEVDIPGGIDCDSFPGPLGQVIANLSQNAITHGFHGRDHGRLRIWATATAATVELHFDDDGRGMEEAVRTRIFEPFFTTTLGKGGSGLGLSIAYNIVTGVLGGSMQVDSTPGQGARFKVDFPRVAPARNQAE